jgi:hypothetical protein
MRKFGSVTAFHISKPSHAVSSKPPPTPHRGSICIRPVGHHHGHIVTPIYLPQRIMPISLPEGGEMESRCRRALQCGSMALQIAFLG